MPLSTPTPINITHNPAASRFEADFDGRLAVCAYHLANGVMHLTHTEVPPSLQGQGIAAQLVRETLQWARNEGLRVRSLCSYVSVYMRRHPETQDLIA